MAFLLVAISSLMLLGGSMAGPSMGNPSTSSNYCAKKLLSEFQLGVPFKSEVESLLNVAFPQKEQCAQFAAFLWTQLEQWSTNLGQWGARGEAFRRHQLGNVLLIAHYRATRGELTAPGAADRKSSVLSGELLQRIEMLLKDAHFEEELFLSDDNSFVDEAAFSTCSAKVNRTLLKVQKPFSPSMTAYLDGLKPEACDAFQSGLQSAIKLVSNFSGTGVNLWAAGDQDEPRKLVTTEALFHLLFLCAISSGQQTKGKLMAKLQVRGEQKNHDADVAGANFGCDDVFANPLLLENVFDHSGGGGNLSAINRNMVAGGNSSGLLGGKDDNSSGGGSAFWNILFWGIVVITVLLAVYLSLRFMEVIPGIA